MKKYSLLIVILLLGIFLRFYLLGVVPAGITSDEANNGYDAFSILKTGHDQWNEFLPLFSFKGFGDYRSPLYTYLIIPFISIFDLSPLAVKFPSAIAGAVSVFLMYLLGRKLFNEKIGLFAAFLFSVSPWSVGLSRQGIESNVAIAIYLAGFLAITKGLKNKKYLYGAFILFTLTLFTYTSYIFFTPFSILFLLYFYRNHLNRYKKELVICFFILFIGIIPFLIKSTTAGTARFSQVGLMSDITSIGLIDTLNQKIGACRVDHPATLCRLVDNKLILFSSKFFQNYLHHFSPDFLFISGVSTQYSLLPERGLLYLFEVIIFVLGIFSTLRDKKNALIIIFLLLVSAIPDALSGPGHHSRASVMLPFLIMIESIGAYYLYEKVKKIKSNVYRPVIYLISICIIVFSVFSFFITYLSFYKIYYSSFSNSVYDNLSKEVFKNKNAYKNIYLSTYLNDTPQYIFYLFYNKYDPKSFQNKKSVTFTVEPNGFISIKRINTIHFSNFNFSHVFTFVPDSENTLFIAHPKAFPEFITPKKEYKDLTNGTVFQEVAYNDLAKYYSENK